MKRVIAWMLAMVMTLTGALVSLASSSSIDDGDIKNSYSGLGDQHLLRTIEDTVYSELVSNLDSSELFVENISTVYVSKEYLEELAYNSQANIFFGYTLDQLEEQFDDHKYVFSLGEDGITIVKQFEDYDNTYEQVLKNVAVGSGVILICVTVSVVSAGAGAPAISMIFAASAKSGAIMASSSGVISAASAGIVTGIQTGDINQAMKDAALAGSESFKWGAISGAITGGAHEALALKGATLNGLTMNEAATIQKNSNYPLDVIKEFQSVDQYNILKDSGISTKMVNGKASLVRKIDTTLVDSKGRTNLERMKAGLAALDSNMESYELHHIGQNMDSTLAILTKGEHMKNGNDKIWHVLGEASKIDRSKFATQKKNYWKAIARMIEAGEYL